MSGSGVVFAKHPVPGAQRTGQLHESGSLRSLLSFSSNSLLQCRILLWYIDPPTAIATAIIIATTEDTDRDPPNFPFVDVKDFFRSTPPGET